MDDKIKIVTLGGQDEFGKLLTIVEVNDDIFVIECGEKKPDRLHPGVDYVISNFEYLLANKHRVKAYLLTHGSDPVIGGLPYIYPQVPAPVYLTQATYEVLNLFMRHNKINLDMPINILEPTSEFIVSGHRINFFAITASMSHAVGVSIHTNLGNIMHFGPFVIDNDSLPDFYYARREIAHLADEGVLALLIEARYAHRAGYTNPQYKIVPLMEHAFKDAPGRIFIALETNDMYNVTSVLRYAFQNGRKIIFYDKETIDTFETFARILHDGKRIPKGQLFTIDTINSHSSKDTLVVMVGWGERLYHKLALLASKDNPTKVITLNQSDTIIIGVPYHLENELAESETIDMLYRANAKVVRFGKNDFTRMHASQEDIKTILAITRPKYFIPIYGSFRNLLELARVALSTSIGLTHNNIFVMENGNYIDFVDGKAKLALTSLPHGDIFVDGKGIGDVSSAVLEERQKFADDGVIIIGATLDDKSRTIYAGPDIQMRGFVYLKDSESLLKDITKIVNSIFENHLKNDGELVEGKISSEISDAVFRLIRRNSLKNPMIIPSIAILK